jgi:hypothetical protein
MRPWLSRLTAAALTALVGVLIVTLVASTSRLNTNMSPPAAPAAHHAVERCHPTQHGACWFWTCCL